MIDQAALAAAGYDPGPINGQEGARTYAALLSFAARRPVDIKIGLLYSSNCPKYLIIRESLAQFIANTCNETGGYTVFSENLNYSADGLRKTWPNRFTIASAMEYAHQPERIAEIVYGGRYGNGTGNGDGWRYRGGGHIQTTFKANYEAAQKVTGLPLVLHPELLHDALSSIEPACAYWKGAGCNDLARADPTGRRARIRVNGGTIGLDHVMSSLPRLKTVIR